MYKLKNITIKVFIMAFTLLFAGVLSQLDACDCGDFTHLFDATIGNIKDLPKGFFVYSHNGAVYMSSNNEYNPKMVPNTEGDYPEFLKISGDGKWLLYYARGDGGKIYLIRTNGKGKTQVPGVSFVIPGFYWDSPYGSEIVFSSYRWESDANDPTKINNKIYAMRTYFSEDTVTFGEKRLIVDLKDKIKIWTFAITVSKDRVYFSAKDGDPDYDSVLLEGPTFVTIPDGGKGTATLENVYKFKPGHAQEDQGGCNSAMSHDGTLCVGNVSPRECVFSGDHDGTHYSYLSCVPGDHEGFFMVPFKKETDPPIVKREIADVYGISLNHCPKQFWPFKYTQMGYEGWNFSNKREFLTGFVTGSDSIWHGAWVVEWEKNIWTPLTPLDPKTIYPVEYPAIYFSEETSIRDNSANYPKKNSTIFTNYNLVSVKKDAPFELRFSCAKSNKSVISDINIYDMNGKIINSNYINNGNNFVIFSNNNTAIPNGVYFARINTDDGIQTKRFVIK